MTLGIPEIFLEKKIQDHFCDQQLFRPLTSAATASFISWSKNLHNDDSLCHQRRLNYASYILLSSK